MSTVDICVRCDELQAQTAKVYKTAPNTDYKSYTAAQNAIKNEEEQFLQQRNLIICYLSIFV